MSGPKLPPGVDRFDLLYPYTTIDGRPMRTAKETIEANLGFEERSGTGAGCGQDPENVDKGKE
jgi:hypothetical protein